MSEMKGKICVVTGSNSGIGKETALSLAKMGAHVVMVVRNQERGEKARLEIVKQSGNNSVDLMICDLSSMDSIRRFAQEFKRKYDRLDVLVNNAGAMFNKREVTPEGFERTLAVNYLGPFLLTHELMNLLKSSAPSRIINVSSGLAKNGKVDLDDLQSEKNYRGTKAYSQVRAPVYANTKLMVMMFTYELSRRLKGTGVTANVLMPGFVATNLGKNSGSLGSSLLFKMVRPMQVSAKKGTETSVYLASSGDVKDVTGKCFIKKKEVMTCPESYDEELQKRLWKKTETMLCLASE
ncbi:MAG: SDR family oxidoreductase [Candidatus Bathyarchaeia archaeon]|jgi:NAD(P)-dependent dehydrogenase (short-subunit alcohol dehydrogenase family)